jgi:hypothetical protein
LTYVYIHCLDHSFYTLLAAGYSGFSSVSCFLVAYFAVQITGYCGGWSFWFTEKHHHAARQIVTAVIFCFCFRHNAFTSWPPAFHFSPSALRSNLCQIFMHEAYRHRTFAHCGCYTVHSAGTYIARSKDARAACLQ